MKRLVSLAVLAAVTCVASADNVNDRSKPAMTVDQKFAKMADSGGQFEIRASTLAASRATDPEIKKFAQRMVDDHTKLNNELARITQKRGAASEAALNPVQQAMFAELSKETGADFDECYVGMTILCHEGALMCYRKEAMKGTDAELKAFAESNLPKLREHLMMARKLCDCAQDSTHESAKPVRK